ncbi:hypothetical protein FA15DRAFT_740559 [Coprinopsis marcescibilis]|uniref:F-box domain-containing protein n=1 Tax=Coprinopsis marcescibilis TaxID=230819 RepID=A0A5C3KWA2_COPMA|nr:hypothetical protein FA15DRAFT_740559 [Coprinopsis marcescibilis]
MTVAGTAQLRVLEPAARRAPHEIVHKILLLVRPSFNIHHSSSVGAWVFTARQTDFSLYLCGMRFFLALRLVSRMWNAVVGSIAYREVVVPTRYPVMHDSSEGLQGGVSATSSSGIKKYFSSVPTINTRITNPELPISRLIHFLQHIDTPGSESENFVTEHTRSLVLYDFCHPFGPNNYAEDRGLINSIIKKFANSDIRSLHSYGKETYAFPSRSWVEECLPHLPRTLESLSFDAVDRRTISLALLNLGPFIKSLEIRNRSRLSDNDYVGNPASRIHLPLGIPYLTTLRLVNVAANIIEFRDVFSRIGSATPHGSRSSSLERLSIVQLFVLHESPPGPTIPLTDTEFYELLEINNIADSLTELFIEPGVLSKRDTFSIWKPEMVTRIVKRCPRLQSFGYTSYVHQDLVEHLPQGLEHLELALRPSCHLNAASRDVSYLQSYPRFTEFVRRAMEIRSQKKEFKHLKVLLSNQLQQTPGFWRLSFEEVNELFQVGKAEFEAKCVEGGIELSFEVV